MSRKLVVLIACAIVGVGSLVGLVLAVLPTAAPAPPRVSIDVHVVPNVMTAVYKIYGGEFSDKWLARSTIRNTGTTPITNFRIEYQIPGYLKTSSAEDYPVILPGETIRDYCWPTFTAKQMQAIESDTPAELDVTYTYDGLENPVRTTERFTFLGHNSFVYTDLPDADLNTWADFHDNGRFGAAYVTYQDPIVQQLAKRFTGNIGASLSDQDAYDAAAYVFYGLQAMPIKYITEHFDPVEGIQYVQFPADTIANRAGTCVDLAILYDALLESVGIKTYLIYLKGHCQPAFDLPESGNTIIVESTLIRDPSCYFSSACETARAVYEENLKNGTIMWIDVEQEWQNGIVPTW